MMLDYPRLANTFVDTTDVRATAEFYRQLLGLAYLPGHEGSPLGLACLHALSRTYQPRQPCSDADPSDEVARLVLEDGWPIIEVAARFQVPWATVKRWTRIDAPRRSDRDHQQLEVRGRVLRSRAR